MYLESLENVGHMVLIHVKVVTAILRWQVVLRRVCAVAGRILRVVSADADITRLHLDGKASSQCN